MIGGGKKKERCFDFEMRLIEWERERQSNPSRRWIRRGKDLDDERKDTQKTFNVCMGNVLYDDVLMNDG